VKSGLCEFKFLESLEIEGTFKLKKVFTSRSQIPFDHEEEILSLSLEKNVKIEEPPPKLRFSKEVASSN